MLKEKRHDQETTKTNVIFPASLWRETKKAAIDRGVSAQQFVVDVLAEELAKKRRGDGT